MVLHGLTKAPYKPLEEASLKLLLLDDSPSGGYLGHRISEIQALSNAEPFFRCLPGRIVLKTDPGFFPKVPSMFHFMQEIVLPTFLLRPQAGRRGFLHLGRQEVPLEMPRINKRSQESLFLACLVLRDA